MILPCKNLKASVPVSVACWGEGGGGEDGARRTSGGALRDPLIWPEPLKREMAEPTSKL